MHLTRRILLPCLLAALAITGAACNGDLLYFDQDAIPDIPDLPDDVEVRIEVVGPDTIEVEHYMEPEVKFRLVNTADDTPVGAQPMYFELDGDLGGASLALNVSQTDPFGDATATVRAGTDGRFFVVASHPSASNDARVEVVVRPGRFGDINYTLLYEQDDDRTELESAVGAFPDVDCTTLSEMALDGTSPAPHTVDETSILGGDTSATGTLRRVVRGTMYSVFVVSKTTTGVIAAYGCTEVTPLDPGQEIEIEVVNTRVRMAGVYASIERMDMTDGLPPALDTVLDVLDQLATNPAGFIIDRAEDIFGIDFPGGDLVRAAVEEAVNWAVDTFILTGPWGTVIDVILDIGSNLNRALSNLILYSDLEFEELNDDGTGVGHRRIHTFESDTMSEIVTEELMEAEADFTYSVDADDNLHIDPHEVPLSFGEVVETIVTGIVDSIVGGTLDSLFFGLVDCDDQGGTLSWRDEACGFIEDIFETVIDWISDQIGSLIFDTLILEDRGPLESRDYDYQSVDDNDGTVDAEWSGLTTISFPGTFEMNRTVTPDHWFQPIDDALMMPEPPADEDPQEPTEPDPDPEPDPDADEPR